MKKALIIAGILLGTAVAAICILKREEEEDNASAGTPRKPRSHHLTNAFAHAKLHAENTSLEVE